MGVRLQAFSQSSEVHFFRFKPAAGPPSGAMGRIQQVRHGLECKLGPICVCCWIPCHKTQDLLISAEDTNQPGSAKIDPHMAQACNAARAQVKTIIDDNGAESGDTIQQYIEKNTSALLCIDRDFGVELAVLDLLAGTSSEARLIMHILAAMPTHAKAIEPESALQSLTNLSRREVTKLANRPAQAKLQVCIKTVGRIVDGRELDVADIRFLFSSEGVLRAHPLFYQTWPGRKCDDWRRSSCCHHGRCARQGRGRHRHSR